MVTLQNSDLANSSKEKQLRYVEDFYEFAGQLKGYKPLDDVIADVDLEALGEILEAFMESGVRYFVKGTDVMPTNDESGLSINYQVERQVVRGVVRINEPT